MARPSNHFQSSVGSKVVMALSGLGLVLYVVFHMLGNLQVFEGPHALNGYAAFIRDMPIVLWTARIGLLSLAALHIALAIQSTLRNRRARPVAYAVREYRQASLASRTMAVSGLVLLLFLIFHLLHLTAGVLDPSSADRLDVEGHRDVYGKIVQAFQNPFIVAFYVVGQLGLGFHLSHAVSSSMQTLGLEHAALNRLFKVAGPAVALFVVVGNVAIILAVFLGVVRL
ncbi:succinate dehydrogenase cytochrome b subunit [Candidatus Nitrospira nitrificans]|jgi:succinate dehydrogenase / fumarate reductase cytochrome b subunit|uniref:Succinate dehydrogenase cytochrome b558 subunit n=1 Tax=Candidatus Nitrospira nitrificans TaxID=1742973 RepID=A0A0S4LPS7_9BACT